MEALEQDMTTLLATKQDLQLLRNDFSHLERLTTAKIEALTEQMSLQFQNLELHIQASESRVVIRLSAVMVALVGTVLAILR